MIGITALRFGSSKFGRGGPRVPPRDGSSTEHSDVNRRRWLLLGLLAWLVELGILLALPRGGSLRFAVDCAGWTALGVALWWTAFQRAHRERDAGIGWRLIGLSGLALAFVSAFDAVLFAIYGRLPLPPIAIAIMDDSTWVLALAGLLAWTGRGLRRDAALRATLDGTLLAIALFLLAWWAGGSDLVRPGVSVLRTIRSVLPFAFACTSLGVVAYLAARSPSRLKGPLGWLGAGHFALLLGALGYAWATMRGAFYPGHSLDALFQIPLFFFALAPTSTHPLPNPITGDDPGSDLGDVLTNLPAAVALAIAVVRHIAGVFADPVTIVCGMSLVALLLARQFLAVHDVRMLSRTLEARVIERTRALEESQRALITAQRMEAIGRLAGGVAHDFNNVLAAIGGHVDLLRGTLDHAHTAHEDVAAIRDAVHSGSDLARRLLSFAKPVASSPRLVSGGEAVVRAGQLARGLARGRVSVETRIDENAGDVFIDPVLLDQVLTNLATNGIDAMASKGVLTLEATSIDLSTPNGARGPREGHYVHFAVSDTGSGMDEATMCRIFEPFFTTKGDGRGTGLGLPTAYAIVTQAGGSISVRSHVGEGTRFDVLLPRAHQA
jgi:signal transduction histidine kinase